MNFTSRRKQTKTFSIISAILALVLAMSSLFCGCTQKPTAPETTTKQTQTQKPTNKTEDVAYVPNVTFSAKIAEVNGVVYATRKATKTSDGMFDMEERKAAGDIPTCKTIPIETKENEIVSGFCYYDKYVYYVISTSGSADFSTALYRCKPDWTESELICENPYEDGGEYSMGARDFVIDSGYLYYGNHAFDLPSLTEVEKDYPQYSIPGVTDSYYIQIFDDMIFYDDFSDDLNRKIYYYDGKTSKLIAENATLDGGYACGYLYFARATENPNGTGAMLYRYNMQTNKTEEVHELELISGGEGPYFCW